MLRETKKVKEVKKVAGMVSSNGHCPLSPVLAHWWRIETPQGRISNGVCKYCGTEREFYNWFVGEFER